MKRYQLGLVLLAATFSVAAQSQKTRVVWAPDPVPSSGAAVVLYWAWLGLDLPRQTRVVEDGSGTTCPQEVLSALDPKTGERVWDAGVNGQRAWVKSIPGMYACVVEWEETTGARVKVRAALSVPAR